MKKSLFGIAAAFMILASCNSSRRATTTSANSSTSTSSNSAYSVPSNIQSGFSSQYPNAGNVAWSRYDANVVPIDWDLTDWSALTPSDYAVRFDMNGNKYYAWYDANGNWIGSTYAITDNNGLPAAVNAAITQRYNGYTIDKINRVMWKDRTAYDVKLKMGDNKQKILIDENGTVIKEKK